MIVRCDNPKKKLLFQRLPVKEDVTLVGDKHKEVNRLRNGYITQILAKVVVDEIVKTGGKKCSISEWIIYKEFFKVSSFKKVIENLFDLK